jgi:hypothetical protein
MEGEEQNHCEICKEEPFAEEEEEEEEEEDPKERKRNPWSFDPFDGLPFATQWVTQDPFAEDDYEYVLMRRNNFPTLFEKMP